MYKVDEGYKHRYSKKEMDRMFQEYTDNTYKCKCGHSVFVSNKEKKWICSYCGRYVFRDKKDEFMYRLKEVF